MSRLHNRRTVDHPEHPCEPGAAPLPQARLLALQRAAGNRAVATVVQRQLARSATTESAPYDLATQIVNARELAITPPVVNGQQIPVDAGTVPAIEAALVPPALTTTQSRTATGGRRARVRTRFVARVASVPSNSVGAHLRLPQPPPSTVVADPSVIEFRLGLTSSKSRLRHGWIYRSAQPEILDRRRGNSSLTIRGQRGDAQFSAAIRAHEMHHADDHWAGAQEILGPWDRKLSDPGMLATGASAKQAKKDLHQAAGGTRRELAERLSSDWTRRDAEFHADPAGRQSDLKSYWISKDGSEVIAHWGY